MEDGLPEMGVGGIELVGQLATDGFRFREEFMEMAGAGFRDHAPGTEQEDEALEEGGIFREADGFETFVGLLVGAFIIDADFPHGGDEDPIAGQIDGIAVTLIHSGHFPASECDFERIARPFAFHRHDIFLFSFREAA